MKTFQTPPSKSCTKTTSTFPLTVLGNIKCASSIALLLAPNWTMEMVYYRALNPNSNESSRTRELLFGALLLGAKSSETRPAAVLASAALDVLDLVATIWGWEMGQKCADSMWLFGWRVSQLEYFTFVAGASALLAGLAWKKAGLGRALTTRKL
ncbi:uncharacterized protein RAG0_07603 [Rhynchosporium agropyri]|uniref:Uncharacterized protein n=1 Tax=Rhynchosporium agropyri TaxID=914238 RepID=A0A1E1KQF4_9HELO|nr:uncharacterized protein RAG0_07603 [Rhynchosporium agropyri]